MDVNEELKFCTNIFMTKSSQKNVPDVEVDLGFACNKLTTSLPTPSYHT